VGDPLEELLLGPEVVHDQAGVHPGRARDAADGGPLIAGLDEQAGSRLEDPRLGPQALLCP